MQDSSDSIKAYLKYIVVWGLPGLYVAVILYIATVFMAGIRVL